MPLPFFIDAYHMLASLLQSQLPADTSNPDALQHFIESTLWVGISLSALLLLLAVCLLVSQPAINTSAKRQ